MLVLCYLLQLSIKNRPGIAAGAVTNYNKAR